MSEDTYRARRQYLAQVLRAGHYIQLRGALRADDGEAEQHCAAGVACELYRWEEGGYWERLPWTEETHRFLFRFHTGGGQSGIHRMPDAVREYYGLTPRQAAVVTRLNDHHMDDFETVAEYLART